MAFSLQSHVTSTFCSHNQTSVIAFQLFHLSKFCCTQTYLIEGHRSTAIGAHGNVEPVQVVLRPGQIVVGADLLNPGALIVPVGGIL